MTLKHVQTVTKSWTRVFRSQVEAKDQDKEFNASKEPPFTLGQIRATIPKHCWERSTTRSLCSVANDITLVVVLASVASIIDKWLKWALCWFAQGTMFWTLFVQNHVCGHISFSPSKHLNNFLGLIKHSFILVPYHDYRISHQSLYETLSVFPRLGRMQFPFPFYAYPFYLWCRTPGKSGTHYSPSRDLFNASEWKEVLTTTASWLVMVAILAAAVSHMGFLWTLKVYFVPYVVNIVDLLRHIPPPSRIREENSLVPRPGMELHSRRATAALKPLLGNYYQEPQRSGLIPVHLISILVKSFSEDHYVADEGDIVYYQKDTKGRGSESILRNRHHHQHHDLSTSSRLGLVHINPLRQSCHREKYRKFWHVIHDPFSMECEQSNGCL
uniref:Fatty acid desaturase N-terminal domain-containing protein n=1 Tax=Physcomitrium patens TaxID=3218 RepID=A0A7I4DR81_PHYPA